MSTARAVASNLRANVMANAEYRGSSILHVWMTAARAAMAVATIHVLFAQTPQLNGWNAYEVAMVYGMFMIASGIASCIIFPSLTALTENIRTGTLDFSLIKPADAQVVEATQRFDVAQLIPTAGGVVMVAVSAKLAGIEIDAAMAATLAVVACASFLLLYAFHLLVATTAFWFVKLDMLMDQLHEMFNIARWPTSIYPRWMDLAVSVLLPATVAVTVPSEVLVGRATAGTLAATLAAALMMTLLARAFWTFAVSRYSGASA